MRAVPQFATNSRPARRGFYFGNSSRPSRRVEEYLALARKLGLSCPVGRAIYAASRNVNAGPIDAEAVMSRARLETAERWLEHWRRGGSLKSLGLSQNDWLERRASEEHCRTVIAVRLVKKIHEEQVIRCNVRGCVEHRRGAVAVL